MSSFFSTNRSSDMVNPFIDLQGLACLSAVSKENKILARFEIQKYPLFSPVSALRNAESTCFSRLKSRVITKLSNTTLKNVLADVKPLARDSIFASMGPAIFAISELGIERLADRSEIDKALIFTGLLGPIVLTFLERDILPGGVNRSIVAGFAGVLAYLCYNNTKNLEDLSVQALFISPIALLVIDGFVKRHFT
ncbi:MAG: hypothetical protein H0X29_03885 [Parachlamydiaceae bacterium]|nr:hypothetical protein [Parachlamydiaceae bacterium]